eukprot:jgi/Bigna1/126363/aug1.2_g1071
MGKKAKKSTKSFQKKHLSQTIQSRRRRKNIQSARKMREERKNARAEAQLKAKKEKQIEEEIEARESSVISKTASAVDPTRGMAVDKSSLEIEDMDLDTFLEQGLDEDDEEDDEDFEDDDDEDEDEDGDDDDDDEETKFMEVTEKDEDDDDDDDDDDEDAENEADEIVDQEEEEMEEAALMKAMACDDDDDEEEEDEDEDEEEDEDDDDEQALENEILMHQAELKKLAEKDPEFHRHLQQYDSSLLEFEGKSAKQKGGVGEGGDDEEDVDEDDEEAEEDHEAEISAEASVTKAAAADGSGEDVITLKKFKKIFKEALTTPSLRKVKKITRVQELFKPLLDDAEKLETKKRADREKRRKKNGGSGSGNSASESGKKEKQNKIAHGNRERRGSAYYAHLSNLPKWKKWGPVVRVFAKSHTNFLSKLVDKTMIRYVVSKCAGMRPLYGGLATKMAERLLRCLLNLWANSPHDDVAIDSFVEIRGLVVALGDFKPEVLEFGLKHSYLVYCKTARFTSPRTMPRITFMADCISKLYTLDSTTGYRYAFIYIRQLAIHLRNAIVTKKNNKTAQAEKNKTKKKKNKQKKKDAGKQKGSVDATTEGAHSSVYNWQYINGLRAWSTLLKEQAKGGDSELRPLVYPFIQVALGVITLHPTARYWPLLLQVMSLVMEVAGAASVYVPLAGHMLLILESKEFTKKAKPSTQRPPEWKGLLHATLSTVNTRQYQEEAARRTLHALARYLNIYAYAAAFPEISTPTVVALRKLSKKSRMPPLIKKQAAALASILKESGEMIKRQRAATGIAPVTMLRKVFSPSVFPRSVGTSIGMCPVTTFKPQQDVMDDVSSSAKKKKKKKNRRSKSGGGISPITRYVQTLLQAENDRDKGEEKGSSNQQKAVNSRKKSKKNKKEKDDEEGLEEKSVKKRKRKQQSDNTGREAKKKQRKDDDDEDEEADVVKEFDFADLGDEDDDDDDDDDDDEEDDDEK